MSSIGSLFETRMLALSEAADH